MERRVCIIQGHPDGTGGHFCHALGDAYARGAEDARRSVSRLDIAALAPAPLADPGDFATPPEGTMLGAQQLVREAHHLVILFPLWLGTMPAMLKAFFEQLARAEFALGISEGGWPKQNLKGRSARIVVTMGMPALAFRLLWGAAGVRCLRGGILKIAGVSPVRTSYIGGIEDLGVTGRAKWLARMEDLGRDSR